MFSSNTVDNLDEILPNAPFHERHTRKVDLPLEEVWPALLAVELDDIALFGPLMKLRTLPAKLLGRPAPLDDPDGDSFLEMMTATEFTMIRRDSEPIDGRGLVVFGAVGKFWAPIGNKPIDVDAEELLELTVRDTRSLPHRSRP